MKAPQKIISKINEYGKLVMFSHTIFSLSFALISMTLAAGGIPKLQTLFWILIAFMGARTGANAINRVIDAEIDKKNPRTTNRQIPKGEIKKAEVTCFAGICFMAMILGAYNLNLTCLILSPTALFLLIIYSYCKRFTWLCHLVLGITCSCAPVGAWVAIRGLDITCVPLLMGAANTLWVAGFDIIYGSQDYEFDKGNGIYSIPARFGVKNALRIAMLFHIITAALLIGVGIFSEELGIIYYVGVGIIAGLLTAQYKLVSSENLTNVNIASYSVNQLVSLSLMAFGLLDVFLNF